MEGSLRAGSDAIGPLAVIATGVPFDGQLILCDEDVLAEGFDLAAVGEFSDAIPAFGGVGGDFDDDGGVGKGVFGAIGVLEAATDYHQVGEKAGCATGDLQTEFGDADRAVPCRQGVAQQAGQ